MEKQSTKGIRSQRARKAADKPEAKAEAQQQFDNLFNPEAKPKRTRKTAPKAEPKVTEQVTDAEPIKVESDAITVSGPISVDGRWIEDAIDANVKHAEELVLRLIDTQSDKDKTEHDVILEMVEDIRKGIATVKEFCEAYAALAASKMTPNSVKSRKSNLSGVLSYANEHQPYLLEISKEENARLNLQGMYEIRQKMLKDNGAESRASRNKGSKAEASEESPMSNMSPDDVMMQQIANAIDAAADAGYPDIAERLRIVFYASQLATKEKATEPEEIAVL